MFISSFALRTPGLLRLVTPFFRLVFTFLLATASTLFGYPLLRGKRKLILHLACCLQLAYMPQVIQAQELHWVAQLDPIVVSATRIPEKLSSVLADVTVLDQASITKSSATSLADLLATLPGIQISRNGGPSSTTSVYMRGAQTQHTAVYLNGVRIDSQSTGGATWEQIPLDQIERIEIKRGPAAAVYGSDALAGVIQLFTHQGLDTSDGKPFKPRASVILGSKQTKQAQLSLGGVQEALDYSVALSSGSSTGFDARTAQAPDHNPDQDGWQQHSLQAQFGLQITPAARLEAALVSSQLDADFDDYTFNTDDKVEHTLNTGSLAWQYQDSEQDLTRFQVGQTDSEFTAQPNFYQTQTQLNNYTLTHTHRLLNHRLSLVLERREDELINAATEFSTELRGERTQNAIGLGWHLEWGQHSWQAHTRHDNDSQFGDNTTASLAWGWRFQPQWLLRASSGTAFRAPTLYQLLSEYGNASLEAEKGRNTELSLRWTQAKHEVSLTAWHNKIKQLITFGEPGPCVNSFGCYANTDRTLLKGATLAASSHWESWVLQAALDWMDPRNIDTDKILPRRAQRQAKLGIATQIANWHVGTEVLASSKRFDDNQNTQKLGGYTLWNATLQSQLNPSVSLQIKLNNLGNKQYELAQTYATPGREATVSLNWTLP